MFKYCPFCGQKLVSTGSIVFKYCPECGGQLGTNTEEALPQKKPAKPDSAQVATAEMQREAKQFFDKLRGKLPSPSNRSSVPLAVAASDADGIYYSIILKNCADKEKLVHTLQQVLARSFLAIRMAIDNMPDILVYKGKVAGLAPIVKALRSQNAAFSIVPGNFDFKASLTHIFPDFNSLFPEVQTLIRGMPISLWLGEKVLGVFPDVCLASLREADKGVLVVGDQALYFVYKEINAGFSAVVIPYSRIEQLFLEEGREADGLLLRYKDGRDEDMLVIDDELILSEAFEASSKAFNNQQNSLWIKAVCPKCGHSEQQAVDDEAAKRACVFCDEMLHKTLVKNELM